MDGARKDIADRLSSLTETFASLDRLPADDWERVQRELAHARQSLGQAWRLAIENGLKDVAWWQGRTLEEILAAAREKLDGYEAKAYGPGHES